MSRPAKPAGCQPCQARRAAQAAQTAAAKQRRTAGRQYVVQDPAAPDGEVLFDHLVDARMYQRKKGLAVPTVRP